MFEKEYGRPSPQPSQSTGRGGRRAHAIALAIFARNACASYNETMPHARYNSKEIARIGQEIYDTKIRHEVEVHGHGQILVIDIESGNYEMDPDHLTASHRARAKHPGGAFFAVKVGYPTLARIGGSSLRPSR